MARTQSIQSLARGLSILEQVGRAPQGLSLQAIAEFLGVGPSTAHALAQTLVTAGYLVKTVRPIRYCLGDKVEDLAIMRSRSGFLLAAEAEIAALAEAWPQAALSLSEYGSGEVVMRLYRDSHSNGVIQPWGRIMHAYSTGSAMAYQAFASASERAAYRVTHPFGEQGVQLWNSLDELEQHLELARQQGYVICQFSSDDVLNVVVPVFQRGKLFRAVLGGNLPLVGLADEGQDVFMDQFAAAARRLSV